MNSVLFCYNLLTSILELLSFANKYIVAQHLSLEDICLILITIVTRMKAVTYYKTSEAVSSMTVVYFQCSDIFFTIAS